jgi:8-oxo-dGTP diphosphatase
MTRHTYEFPRPALTVDAVVFGLDADDLEVLLIERGHAPFAGQWALPGGFVHMDETLEAAVRRELREETGLHDLYLEQLFTFGDPGRDPRDRVITVAYYALVRRKDHAAEAGTDAAKAAWFPVSRLPALAFDHGQIIEAALQRLKGKLSYQPIGFELLPETFSLGQLQRLYEIVLGRELDKRNFRKKALTLGILQPTEEVEQGVPHRAARLYRFDEAAYRKAVAEGFTFEL